MTQAEGCASGFCHSKAPPPCTPPRLCGGKAGSGARSYPPPGFAGGGQGGGLFFEQPMPESIGAPSQMPGAPFLCIIAIVLNRILSSRLFNTAFSSPLLQPGVSMRPILFASIALMFGGVGFVLGDEPKGPVARKFAE